MYSNKSSFDLKLHVREESSVDTVKFELSTFFNDVIFSGQYWKCSVESVDPDKNVIFVSGTVDTSGSDLEAIKGEISESVGAIEGIEDI